MQSEFQWFNEPPQWETRGGIITVTSSPKSDFWVKTHYGFVRDSGHFYSTEIHGDFTAEVQVRGQYAALYDQAGLMLRLDGENWIKTGIEYFEETQHASAVVTRGFSDWSVAPLTGSPEAFWLRVRREGDAVEIFYSLDGTTYTLLRVAYFPAAAVTQVGLMCASPEGPGFSTEFEGFTVSPITAGAHHTNMPDHD